MKKSILMLVSSALMMTGCTNQAEKQRIEREKFVKDSVNNRIDSLSNTDARLSFMGITLGESVDSITIAAKKTSFRIDGEENGIVFGSVYIPYTIRNIDYSDGHKDGTWAKYRIVKNDSLVAAIELTLSDGYAYDFFQNTFSERYYDQRLLEESPSRCYIWRFKGKHIEIKNHSNYQEKVYMQTVEYIDSSLFKPVMDRAIDKRIEKEYMESLKKDSVSKATEERNMKMKENI